MQNRRTWCIGMGALLGAVGISGCGGNGSSGPKQPERIYTAEERARIHKYRGVRGYESKLSGFGKTSEEGVYAQLRNEQGQLIRSGTFWAGGGSTSGVPFFTPLGPAKSVHVRLMDPSDSKYAGDAPDGESIISGTVFGEWDVPIADRIPDVLLDDLRKNPKGGLRIKLRFHREGVLLGWDIERRPGYDENIRDRFGEVRYVPAVHSFAGGDFREAHIFNGKAVRKGWFIHPRTKQRIETDF